MTVSVARKTKRHSNPALLNKLKTVLTEIAATPTAMSLSEGEAFVCSVCQLPVKLCTSDPTICCAHMRLEGTELQLVRSSGKRASVTCVQCGTIISKSTLKKNPLTELCPSCQKSSSKSRLSKRSKGASL
jgi:hypothetical protein